MNYRTKPYLGFILKKAQQNITSYYAKNIYIYIIKVIALKFIKIKIQPTNYWQVDYEERYSQHYPLTKNSHFREEMKKSNMGNDGKF